MVYPLPVFVRRVAFDPIRRYWHSRVDMRHGRGRWNVYLPPVDARERPSEPTWDDLNALFAAGLY
jgi:hypothetical protein